MRTLTMTVAAAMLASLLMVGPAIAATPDHVVPSPQPGAHVTGLNASAGHQPSTLHDAPTESSSTATPLPPPPVGKCKTDAALKERCTSAWNACVIHVQRNPNACKNEWRACCNNKPVRN